MNIAPVIVFPRGLAPRTPLHALSRASSFGASPLGLPCTLSRCARSHRSSFARLLVCSFTVSPFTVSPFTRLPVYPLRQIERNEPFLSHLLHGVLRPLAAAAALLDAAERHQ